jgi:hypothetical protein
LMLCVGATKLHELRARPPGLLLFALVPRFLTLPTRI